MSEEFLVPVMAPVQVPFVSKLGVELSSWGHSVTYVPQNVPTNERMAEHVPETEIESGHLSHEPSTDIETLLRRFDIHSPRGLVFPQMVYDFNYDYPSYEPLPPSRIAAKRSQRYVDSCIHGGTENWPRILGNTNDFEPYLESLHRTLDFFDQYFSATGGGIPLHEQGAEILRRVLQRVADAHDIPSVWVGFSPLPNESGLYTTEDSYWAIFDRISVDELSGAEMADAREHLDHVRSTKPLVGDSGPRQQHVLLAGLTGLLSGDASVLGISSYLLQTAKSKIKARKYMSPSESREFIRENDYVFFPLQYPLESRLTMRGSEFYNQAWLIEYLSRSLPYGVELVVKDHPKHVGLQSSSIIDVMQRYSHPLHPATNAHDVIEEASAVICINNTIGYEAIVHGKPVVTLGDAVYAGHGYTIDVADVGDVPEALATAVRSDGLTTDQVLEFCHGILSGSRPGVWNDTSDENVQRLAESISEFAARAFDEADEHPESADPPTSVSE